MIFGTIFGIVDVEDFYKNKVVLYTVLNQEVSVCEPIGMLLGAFAGFMIEFLRQQELQMRPDTPITDYFNDSSDEDEERINGGHNDDEKDYKRKEIVQKFNFSELKTDSDTDEEGLNSLIEL